MPTIIIIVSLIFLTNSYLNDTSFTAYQKNFIESGILNDGSALGLPS